MSDTWSSDAIISMPEPPASDQPVLVDLEGFGFTSGGICHNLTEADHEKLMAPHWAPAGEHT